MNRRERRGVTALLVVLLLLLAANRLIYKFERSQEAVSGRFERMLAELDALQEASAAKTSALKLFPFDPNTIDSLALDSLALPTYVKRNLLHYRIAGGHFRRSSDFRRLYGINDSIFAALSPYLHIQAAATAPVPIRTSSYPVNSRIAPPAYTAPPPPDTPAPYIVPKPAQPTADLTLELNSATAAELEQLPAIGETLAQRIVKFRALMGGFHSTEQLVEVYGITAETVAAIAPSLTVDPTLLRRIDLNFASRSELSQHPCIGRNNAQKIISYRDRNGFIESPEQLLTDSVLPSADCKKILPYLIVK